MKYFDANYGPVADTRVFLECGAAALLSQMQRDLSLSAVSFDQFARMLRAHGLDDLANMATAEAMRRYSTKLTSDQIARATPPKRWWQS